MFIDDLKEKQNELRAKTKYNEATIKDTSISVIKFLLDNHIDSKYDSIKKYIINHVNADDNEVILDKDLLIENQNLLNNLNDDEVVGYQFIKQYIDNDGIVFIFDGLSSTIILKDILKLFKKNYKELNLNLKKIYTTKDFEYLLSKNHYSSKYNRDNNISQLVSRFEINSLNNENLMFIINNLEKEKVRSIDETGHFRFVWHY